MIFEYWIVCWMMLPLTQRECTSRNPVSKELLLYHSAFLFNASRSYPSVDVHVMNTSNPWFHSLKNPKGLPQHKSVDRGVDLGRTSVPMQAAQAQTRPTLPPTPHGWNPPHFCRSCNQQPNLGCKPLKPWVSWMGLWSSTIPSFHYIYRTLYNLP